MDFTQPKGGKTQPDKAEKCSFIAVLPFGRFAMYADEDTAIQPLPPIYALHSSATAIY